MRLRKRVDKRPPGWASSQIATISADIDRNERIARRA
jgi:hypothetical protein